MVTNHFMIHLRQALTFIILTYISVQFILIGLLISKGVELQEMLMLLGDINGKIVSNKVAWGILIVPYILFLVFRYIYLGYRNFTNTVMGYRMFFSLGIPLVVFFLGYAVLNQWRHSENFSFDPMTFVSLESPYLTDVQKGVHLFSRHDLDEIAIEELNKCHIEWITLVPYGYQSSPSDPVIGRRNAPYGQLNRRDSSLIKHCRDMRANDFKVMIKPHIWMHTDGKGWRSDIFFQTEPEWQEWEEGYRRFILHYAQIAKLCGAEQFCIGTELHQVVKNRPDFWRKIIGEVREVYGGPITYAANWFDEVIDVSFWDLLDFIGIQAYYPVANHNNPSVDQLLDGWKPHFKQIKAISTKYNRPVLFTELGYKSTPDAAIEPWKWASDFKSFTPVSHETQANCYEAFFRTFWNKPWFAGVHFWEWKPGVKGQRGQSEINFTPQNKPAAEIMAKWFEKK